jgi:zinc protease
MKSYCMISKDHQHKETGNVRWRGMFVLCLILLGFTASTNLSRRAGAVTDYGPVQSSSTVANVTVDQILESYVRALGGREALQKLTSRVTVQSVNRQGNETLMEIYEKAPNKRLVVTMLSDSEKAQAGYDGRNAWFKGARGPTQESTGNELAKFARDAEFGREMKLKELFSTLTLKGTQSINGRRTYQIEATPAAGPAENLYFDVETGLLIRRVQPTLVMIRESDDEALRPEMIEITLDYDSYRVVDGVKYPFEIKRHERLGTSLVKVQEVKHNVAIDDSKFNKPSA